MKKVRVIYDPILRTKAKPVTVFGQPLKKLAAEMLTIMHQKIGMGLAANQLGIDQDLFVIEYRPVKDDRATKPIGPLALCNAKVVKTSQAKVIATEGCLSLPKIELPVERFLGVTVEAQGLDGQSVRLKAKGLLARILQHEINHLNGRLFTDLARGVKDLKSYVDIKIVFFGSDTFSTLIFNRLVDSGLNIIAVITETDKPAGRGGEITPPPLKTKAKSKNLAVLQPETKDEIVDILHQLQPDLIILASYGKILPEAALEIPTYGALNVHPSLLPKYRGPTPLQSVILMGERETGVTIMKMNAGVDTGEMVAQNTILLTGDETFTSLRDQLANSGVNLLISQLPIYLSGQAILATQNQANTTITTKLTKEMGQIDWTQPAEQIDRQIRALNPWPGTFTFLGQKRLKILRGQVSDGKMLLQSVQLEGKNPTDWVDFVRGYDQELKKTVWFGKIH